MAEHKTVFCFLPTMKIYLKIYVVLNWSLLKRVNDQALSLALIKFAVSQNIGPPFPTPFLSGALSHVLKLLYRCKS
jgi:hypothetical protein